MEQEVITDIIKNNSLSHFLEYEGTQLSTLFLYLLLYTLI